MNSPSDYKQVVVVFTQTASGADDEGEQFARLYPSKRVAETYLQTIGYKKMSPISDLWGKYHGFHNEYTAVIVKIEE